MKTVTRINENITTSRGSHVRELRETNEKEGGRCAHVGAKKRKRAVAFPVTKIDREIKQSVLIN